MRKDDGLLDGASGTGREIDRRTIAKGVAWTVPVVIVATAAPAAAASAPLPPVVSFTQAAGAYDPQAGAVAFSLELSSSGSGQIQFTLMDGVGSTGLPYVTAIAAGPNAINFTVQTTSPTRPSTLTYTVDGGATYSTVVVPVSTPTSFLTASRVGTGTSPYEFRLVFSGSESSKVEVVDVTSTGNGGNWTQFPRGPQALTLVNGQLRLDFTTKHVGKQTAAPATITFRIDGGSAQSSDPITL